MTMLEKMAQAFMTSVAAQEWAPYVSNGPDDDANDLEPRIDGTVELIPAMRAALMAIRPHSIRDLPEGALLVGEEQLDRHVSGYSGAADVFAAMIDAILAEKPEGGA